MLNLKLIWRVVGMNMLCVNTVRQFYVDLNYDTVTQVYVDLNYDTVTQVYVQYVGFGYNIVTQVQGGRERKECNTQIY